MARAPKAAAPASVPATTKPKATGKSLATRISAAELEAQLSTDVGSIKASIGAPTSNRIKVDNKNSKLVLPDGREFDRLPAIVVDFVAANRYYPGIYDPQNLSPPVCYSIGRDIQAMTPGDDSPQKQSDTCALCPQNQFDTGHRGKGKACKNTRDVVVVLHEDADKEDAPLYTLTVSPTALKSFDGFIGNAVSVYGHYIKASVDIVATDRGEYTSLTFETPESNPQYALHWTRRTEAAELLNRTPDFSRLLAAPAPKRATAGRNSNTRR